MCAPLSAKFTWSARNVRISVKQFKSMKHPRTGGMAWFIFRCSVFVALPFIATAQDREVSWKGLLPNLLEDQQSIWTFPARLNKPRDFLPTLAVGGIAAGLFLGADPPIAHYFRNTTSFGDFNHIFNGLNTSIAPALVPAGLLVAGLITKDKKMKDTALFTAEAVADAEIVATALKAATGRARPADLSPHSGFGDSFLEGKSALNSGSFPSGHTIAAFSAATIISRRYGKAHHWVPIAAYGVATAVAFSRMSLSAHFASDVFMGGVMGYSISRFTVLHE
jgi:membrane-associated phospholipid phosphatase